MEIPQKEENSQDGGSSKSIFKSTKRKNLRQIRRKSNSEEEQEDGTDNVL